ncbi:MAG: 16S rRNA (cytidine(1402)-2'-O)-methyltransferase [Proteobacteria bacterium]|nr:16S rRNA (cytidine(1402)-2'-O)-methyltransferase [Pseudomonadota bacterium]
MKTLNKVYMIGTPLGNLEDITLRARQHLQDLPHIFAEDTREVSKLLNLLGISLEGKKLHSYSSHNMKEATDFALRVLKESSIGFVSDRGMPSISDPGSYLVQAAREENISVVPVPGPSAVTTIISVSGFSETAFHFVGFLPNSSKERKSLWNSVRHWPVPVCFFESPRRIRESLEEIKNEFPQGRVFLGREMTKQFEEFSLVALDSLNVESVQERGEFTVLLHPGKIETKAEWQNEIHDRLLSDKEWAKKVAEKSQLSASEVYNALQKEKALRK